MIPRIGSAADMELFARELKLRARAGQVMSELKEQGGDWQTAWRDHPVAREYRALLREAWGGGAQKTKDRRQEQK